MLPCLILTAVAPNKRCAVIYDNTWWPGVIETIDPSSENCTISFMVPQSRRNRFAWPAGKDTDTIHKSTILCMLPEPPQPVTRRNFALPEEAFLFAQEIFNRVTGFDAI